MGGSAGGFSPAEDHKSKKGFTQTHTQRNKYFHFGMSLKTLFLEKFVVASVVIQKFLKLLKIGYIQIYK